MILSTAFVSLFILNLLKIVGIFVAFIIAILLCVVGLSKIENTETRIGVTLGTFLVVMIVALAYNITVHSLR